MKGAARTLDRRSARAIRTRLLDWYDAEKRDLPWRRSRDPFEIWVSETMLQQTRVDAVIPYYERFLERFPDVYALASADLEDVYGVWEGLGYYSRARNLKRAAEQVVSEFGGELPDDPVALRQLPGIGRYTAGALASIAFDRPEPVVDGNVSRVLTRLLGIREDIRDRAVSENLWRDARALADGPRPGDLNQALMELGATRCTKHSPGCVGCPLGRHCDARKVGDAASLPKKTAKRPPTQVLATAIWLLRNDKVLVIRRRSQGLLGGLWELPGGECREGEAPSQALRRGLRKTLRLEARKVKRVGEVQHVFSHRKLSLFVFRGNPAPGRVRRCEVEAHRWVRPSALASLPCGGPTRKALALLAASFAG